MTAVKTECNNNLFDDQLCKKISMAIKRSNLFAGINLVDIVRKRYHIPTSIQDEGATTKKFKETLTNNNNINNCLTNTEKISNSNMQIYSFLPPPETLFQSTPIYKANPIKMECVVEENTDTSTNIYMFNHNDSMSIPHPINPVIQSFDSNTLNLSETREKSPKRDLNRERQNKDLSNLATSLLPLPTQLFGKHSILLALESGNRTEFIKIFKEALQLENEITSDDLCELIDVIIEKKTYSIIVEFISCIKNMSCYLGAMIDTQIKYQHELEQFRVQIFECIESMIDFKIDESITLFIKFCAHNYLWEKMWYMLSQYSPHYIIPENYFTLFMKMFKKYDEFQPSIRNDTLIQIISYISRNYYITKPTYITDIWFYCIYHDINNKELNALMDHDVPSEVIDEIIEKLCTMNDSSFIFGMKLLTKNWNLLMNFKFCLWFSKLISDKSDVRKCLFTIKDSIHALNSSIKQDILDNFYLLGIRVMSYLNQKSLFTCSKNIFENFLKNNFADIKRAVIDINDKFKLKWTMVDCLISSADYEKALFVLKEFEVLHDLEITSDDYNRVKEKLPNLVWHLLNSSQLLPVITLFEQVVSIFIFNESIDSAYTKNCNEIFDLIVNKTYESNDVEVVKKMITLLDLILTADIDFEISKESLRFLAIAAVRTSIPFKELVDFVDTCFKYNVFEKIDMADDGLGSSINAYSDMAYEEIVLLITWMCRTVKISLVQGAQIQGSAIRDNIMKVCSIKFFLHPTTNDDSFCKEIGIDVSFNEFLIKFTEALNNPKYLTHPIKFSTISDASDNCLKIVCDNRIVYNTIYYSDI